MRSFLIPGSSMRSMDCMDVGFSSLRLFILFYSFASGLMESSTGGRPKVSLYDAMQSLLKNAPPGTEVTIQVNFNKNSEPSAKLEEQRTPRAVSSRKSLSYVTSIASATELNPRYVQLYLLVKCFVHYTDVGGKKHTQMVQQEWSSDTTLGDCLKNVVQCIRHKPKNGAVRGVLYTGTLKENQSSPIPLSRKICEDQTIGKLNGVQNKSLRLHFDCNESIEGFDASEHDDKIWYFKV